MTQEIRPTTIFVLVLEALLALPELLLQLREVELTDGLTGRAGGDWTRWSHGGATRLLLTQTFAARNKPPVLNLIFIISSFRSAQR